MGAITGSIKGYINNMIGFVNKLIDAFNSIKVEIPDWVPGFGGQKFGIDLPHVPALATGTNYIPARHAGLSPQRGGRSTSKI